MGVLWTSQHLNVWKTQRAGSVNAWESVAHGNHMEDPSEPHRSPMGQYYDPVKVPWKFHGRLMEPL